MSLSTVEKKTVVSGSPDVVLGRELDNISGGKSCFPL